MIIAPDGYERFPILFNPLNIPEMLPPAPLVEQQDVRPLQAARPSHLETHSQATRNRRDANRSARLPQSASPPSPPIVPDLLAGTVASENSAVLIAARTGRASAPSAAVRAYEHLAPASIASTSVEAA